MNTHTQNHAPSKNQAIILLFLILIAVVYIIYRFGFNGLWTFDDAFSLAGLSEVVDLDSARTFVLGNTTGPTGRPVAMLSFLLNVEDWDQNPAGFRQINVVIHLLNMILVATAAWQIARLIPALQARATGFAVMLALVWGLHPLFASTVLSAVQRMTLLSAFFVMIGINAFLYGRTWMQTRPWRGMLLIGLSLAATLLLATFSKENGALLPAFIGLLELQILSRYRPVQQPYWRPLAWTLLLTPVALFAGHVIWSWQGIVDAQNGAYRAFNWSQRLWSEALILWEYVRQLFVPDIRAMGPLQDDITRIHGMDLPTLTAVAGWVMVLAASWRLRNRYPVLLFGTGFFLLGHLIESSFIQLELYFEHRNYMPALGLLAIPVAGAQLGRHQIAQIAGWVTVPLLAFLLFLNTTTWGNPVLASQRWYSHHPTSLRAIQMRIRTIEETEGATTAATFAKQASDRMPERINIAALALELLCKVRNEATGQQLLNRVERLAQGSTSLHGSLGFLGFMESVLSKRINGQCTWLDLNRLHDILFRFRQDISIQRHPADLSRLHVSLGLLEIHMGKTLEGLNNIQLGFQIHKSYGLFALYVSVLRNLGLEEAAQMLKEDFLSKLPPDISSMKEHRLRVEKAFAGQNAVSD